jgi:uncharacterized membrane protein YbaN (DUF454 family)
MKQRIWRAGKITAGVLLLILGVIGLFLPFLQGVLFLVMGLTLLSTESTRAKAWLHYVQDRAGWQRPSESGRRTDDTRE